MPYREAWALQRALSRRSSDDYLLLLEHPQVFTLGSNADDTHLLSDPASVGADLVRVDRGGDITYHGPGQLIGYPLVTVGSGPHRGPEHVRRVEQVVVDTLVALGVPAGTVGRLGGYPGVWVGLDEPTGPGPRKIAAIGVRTSRGRTTHGFALNVRTDLAMFSHIVPCGIPDKPVTSMAEEGWDVTLAAVVDAVIAAAEGQWGPADDVQRVTDPASVHAGPVAPGPAGTGPAGSGPGSGPGGGAPGPLPTSTVDGEDGEDPAPHRPAVVAPVAVSVGRTKDSALERRLRRSGVDPGAGLSLRSRKPPWLRVTARMGEGFLGLHQDLRRLDLVTVCEEAGCPNIYECWSDGTATFMINGSRCTRACGFCQVDTRHPLPLDPEEPDRVAAAVERMGLAHAVVTCVARDDLADGGAGAFARTVEAIRARLPRTKVEVLISDCKGDQASLETVFGARPDVLNHNIETVARLQRAVRPSAGYARSLGVLARATDAGLTTKSGIIVGMGEHEEEVLATLADLRGVGVEIVTIGQYLRPSSRHLPVARWWSPEEFAAIGEAGLAMGFAHVQSSPLTRSSYHARQAAEASAGAAGASADAPGASEGAPGASAGAAGASADAPGASEGSPGAARDGATLAAAG